MGVPRDRWAETADRYRREGFVVLRGALDGPTTERLGRAVAAAADAQVGDNELSDGTMRFASNLFRTSADVQRIVCSVPVVEIVTTLLGPDAWVRWDQAVWKGPGAPEFPLHQDNGYTGLDDEHLQLWVALTTATAGNGALEVLPGRHLASHPHHWRGAHAVTDLTGERRVVEAEAGDVIAFSSLLPHATGPNTTSRTRLAYVAELLPLGVGDPGVPVPHLVACRDGRPDGRWVPDAASEGPAGGR